MLYFAYGSNMDWGQMKGRCPAVRFVGVAKLPNHRLAFTRKSVNRGCGVADVVRDAGGAVWGAVFEIPDLEVGTLDKSEGYQPGRDKNSYWRRECMVFLDGDDERPLTVATYFAEPQHNPPLPNQSYKDLILAGARHWHLPADYIARLEAIEVAG
jgi:gamma-glutamylcyclotransferase (GGCT)/AIG2-like uncharacterized protein YtfP